MKVNQNLPLKLLYLPFFRIHLLRQEMYFHILLYIIILNILFEKVNSFCSFYSFYTPKHTIYKFRHPIFFEKYISCRKRCIFLLIHIFGKTVKDGGGKSAAFKISNAGVKSLSSLHVYMRKTAIVEESDVIYL